MSELVMCSGLTKTFHKVTALQEVDLQLPEGKIIGLLGPNGSGKTTLLKIMAGLLSADGGEVRIGGEPIGVQTKAWVSYLPDKAFFAGWMRGTDLLSLFEDFYADFDLQKAVKMCTALDLDLGARIKTLSKGTVEKMQLIVAMSRKARLYLLDEPIAGVDPAAREYILHTILTNYSENSSVLISTHLIADVEPVLDEAIFLKQGRVVRHDTVDNIRQQEGRSVDEVFREIFRTVPIGGDWSC